MGGTLGLLLGVTLRIPLGPTHGYMFKILVDRMLDMDLVAYLVILMGSHIVSSVSILLGILLGYILGNHLGGYHGSFIGTTLGNTSGNPTGD